MTNYIEKINVSGTEYQLGGPPFDGGWVFPSTKYVLQSEISSGISANLIRTYSLSGLLPNDGYTYEVMISGSIWCEASSGDAAGGIIATGTVSDPANANYLRLGRVNTRTSNVMGCYLHGTIPVYPNDPNITFKNMESSSSGYYFALYANAYRRIGVRGEDIIWAPAALDANLSANPYDWMDVAYGNGKFVAIAPDGQLSTSTDGTTWTSPDSNTNLGSNQWRSIAYGNNLFVALGYTGYIATSADGTTWSTPTQNANLGSHSWVGVEYGANKYVAIGTNGYVSTSTNGTTWSSASTPPGLGAGINWVGIAYGGNKFVIIGYRSSDYYSAKGISYDGTDWTIGIATEYNGLGRNIWAGITYGSSKFVVLTSTGYVSNSSDGSLWTNAYKNNNLGNNTWRNLTFGDGKFVAIGSAGHISTSGGTFKNIHADNTNVPIGGKNFDGQWYPVAKIIYSGTSISAETPMSVDLTDIIPNDGCDYEAMLGVMKAVTAGASGRDCRIWVGQTSTGPWMDCIMAKTVSSSAQSFAGSCIFPVPASTRTIYIYNSGNTGTTYLELRGIRRLGTNA